MWKNKDGGDWEVYEYGIKICRKDNRGWENKFSVIGQDTKFLH